MRCPPGGCTTACSSSAAHPACSASRAGSHAGRGGASQALREQAAALARERRAFRRCISLVRRGAALAAAEPSGVLVLAVL